MALDVNIVIGTGVRESDKELFFGPLSETTPCIEFPEGTQWPQLLRDVGVFPSSSEARRCGWNGPIPAGFTTVKIGKLKHCVTVLHISGETHE